MKNKMFNWAAGVALIAGLAVSPSALASDSADFTKALSNSPLLERPAKAAGLVTQASAADKQSVAAAVVKAAVALNPSSASDIVSAVARDNPAVAPVAAVTAATLQPKRLGPIAKAAVAAAPSEAANIVAALIKAFPKDYSLIAVAAAEAAPSAGREILLAVADSVPSLQTFIQGAIAGFSANDANLPVQAILSQALAANPSAPLPTPVISPNAPVLSGPGTGVGAPFQPVGTPTVITAFTPETGKRYAAP